MRSVYFILFSLFFSYYYITAQESVIKLKENFEIESIGENLWILEDINSEYSINEVIKSKSFVKNTSKTLNLETSKSTYWLKFKIQNNSSIESLLLEIDNPILDYVAFYSPLSNGLYKKQITEKRKPFKFRKHQYSSYVFDLFIPKKKNKYFYVQVKSTTPIIVPIYITKLASITEKHFTKQLAIGIYIGIILIMFLYNIFVYFTVKEPSYLYYILYIISLGIAQVTIQGYTKKYLWSDNEWLSSHDLNLFTSLGALFAIKFVQAFLDTKNRTKKLNLTLNISVLLFIIAIILSLSNFQQLSFQIIQMNTLVASVLSLITGISIYRKGYQPAKFFLLAWSLLLTGALLFILKDFSILPYNTLTSYIMLIASSFEIMLLSFALGDKINTYKKERLEAIEEKEQILVEQNITLDKQVKEKTQELQASLEELKSTQAKLIQSEKMASLGQLTAGMAHEINNPLNYMSQSVEILKADIEDVRSLLDKYNEVLINEAPNQEKIEAIQKFKEEIQIEFTYKELDRSLEDISDGISRTEAIAKGLNTFSRVDEATFKQADIEQNIDATLELMKHEFAKNKITIEKNYARLPEIDCNPGRLNQVFMNILNNAIYAISHKNDNTEKGYIRIKTSLENNKVIIISFKDNGIGMSEETKNKIFDPFYTTKDVGEGTGLGMSIAHGIIEDHRGTIEVESISNEGSELKIHLPI